MDSVQTHDLAFLRLLHSKVHRENNILLEGVYFVRDRYHVWYHPQKMESLTEESQSARRTKVTEC